MEARVRDSRKVRRVNSQAFRHFGPLETYSVNHMTTETFGAIKLEFEEYGEIGLADIRALLREVERLQAENERMVPKPLKGENDRSRI